MAKAGLSFQSPALQSMGYSVEEALDPYRYYNPTASIGTGGLQSSLADMAIEGQQLVEQTQFTMPEMRTPARPKGPSVGIDPVSGDLFVQGRRFSQQDAATALETEPLLDQPPTGLPEGFRELSPQAYRGFLQTIKDPERGRLFSKNVDIGLANLKQIGGAALSFAGAEQTGAELMTAAKERLRQLEPFQRTFTEIEDTNEFGDWFVANFGQQIPNLLESVAAGLGGAVAGTVIGGPAGTVGGFFGGLLAKQGVKNAVTLAAKKKAEGLALDAAERKLLNQVGGAVAATLGSSYVFGVGDIYGEQLESGAPSRIGAALSAIPYAAADSLGELFIGTRVLGGAAGRSLRDIPTTRGKAGELLKRGAAGLGVGGAIEGATEAFQETLLIANNPEVDIDSPEAINRLINSFAAGAAIGGPLGAAGNIVAKRPRISPNRESNLLNPDEEPNAASQDLTQDPDVPTNTEIPIVTGIPGAGTGREQGVLNLFADLPTEGPEALTQAELLDRMEPTEVGELRPQVAGYLEARPEMQIIPPVTPATEVSPQQGVLQFAEPPPPDQFGIEEGRTALRTVLSEALARQRDMQLIAEEQRKAEAQREAELAAMQRDATIERQLQIFEDAEALARERPAPVERPSAPLEERGPEQLPLDLRRGRLSKAQKKKGAKQLRKALREEAARAEEAAQPEVTRESRQEFLRTAREAGQLPLFTLRGEPSAAAEGRPRTGPTGTGPTGTGPTGTGPTGTGPTGDTLKRGKKTTGEAATKTKTEEAPTKSTVSEDRKTDDDLSAAESTRFNPVEEPTLVNRRDEADIEDVPLGDTRVSGGEREGDITKPNTVSLRFKDIGYKDRRPAVNLQLLLGRLVEMYSNAIKNIQVIAANGAQVRYEGAHHNGGIAIRERIINAFNKPFSADKDLLARLLVHELGHAAHSYLGDTLNKNKRAVAELKAIENYLYPGLRKAINDAEANGYSVDFKFFNYLLSPEELIAEFNVYRLADEPTATRIAPVISELLDSVSNADDLVVPRKVFPTGWRYIDPRTIASKRSMTLADLGVETDATQEGKQPARRKLQRKRADEVVREEGQDRVEPTPVEEESPKAGRGDSLKRGGKGKGKGKRKIERKKPAAETKPLVAPTPEPTLEQEVTQIVEEMSDERLLADAIETAETTRDKKAYELAIYTIMEYAYTPDSNMRKKGLDTQSIEFLNEIPKDAMFKDVLLRLVRVQDSFAAAYERGENKGKLTPLFQSILDAGVLNEAKRLATIRNLPAEFTTGGVSGNKTTKNEKIDDARNNKEKKLSNMITDLNNRTFGTNEESRSRTITELTKMYDSIDDPDYITPSGRALSEYFNEDGTPKTNVIGGKLRIVTKVQSEEDIRRAERDARIDIEALRAIEDDTLTLDDWNTYGIDIVPDEDLGDGRFFTEDGNTIRKPLPVGKIKMVISSFLKKLARPPKVYTFKNQEDMQRRNPQLYARAVGARPQGDFDTTAAVGYSFGDGNVIIFTDRILTEKQLKFVLAHETLGHFGFRGLMSERQLKAALDKVYSEVTSIRDLADQTAEAKGISKTEATEEVLADMAGSLDTNVVARFWNLIKNALNKVGIKFEDDYARYLISQARRYVRNGELSGQMFVPSEVGAAVQSYERMEDPMGSGRFSTQHYDDLGRIAGGYNNIGENGGITGTAEFFEKLRGYKVNAADFGERVLSELKTMNFSARDNFGYRELFKILRDTVQKVNVLRNKYNHMMATALRPAGELFGFEFGKGATEAEINQASEMLSVTSRIKLPEVTEEIIRNLPDLVQIVNGEARVSQAAFDELSKMGRFTIEDFQKGITYSIEVPRAMDDEGRAKITAERDAELAKTTDEKERASIMKGYQILLDAESYTAVVEQEFPAIPDLTEDSNVWKIYNEVRDTMDQSAVDMLLANYAAASGERVKVQNSIETIIGRKLTEGDKAFLQVVEDKFLELRNQNSTVDAKGVTVYSPQSVEQADEFMAAFNKAIIGRDTDRNAEVAQYFDEDQRDDVSTSINEFKQDTTISTQNRFQIQQDIQNLALFELSKLDADRYAKRSIAGSYVPFGREGAWQVRMQAYDPSTGKVLRISEQWRQSLPYYQVANRHEAESLASRVTDLFDIEDGVKLQVLVDGEYKVMPVVLRAEAETARQEVSVNTETNLNEVVSILNRFKVQITPKERERLVTGLTAQNAKARTRLERAGTPGEDKNIVKYVSQHLEATASTVARKENRHRLDTLFDESNAESNKLWFGDEAKYNRLKAEYERLRDDNTASEAAKLSAKRAYEDYRYVFVDKKSKEFGNRFRDRAIRSVEFLESQRSIEYSDFGSGDTASRLKMATVFAQLGGSFATAVLNMVALTTNVLPAMSSYNANNGFGGGFSYGESSTGLVNAISQLAGPNKADSDYYLNLLQNDEALNTSGLTRQDAQFLYDQTSAGTFQAALFNSLLGSARGKVTSGRAQKAIQTWMGMFSYTEQLSRRATGLTAFRLHYRRAIAEGKSPEVAYQEASDFSVDLVEQTLGEYAMFNRPAFFRGDVRQFIFMYKMFVVTSVQMLTAMDRKGQLIMLGTLMLMSGVKGLPFADDLFDLIDTIAQLLGVNLSSSEAELAKLLDDIAPGMTPVLMRGVFDQLLPATISSRVSLGDMIPGTGIALAGADLGRELINIAGPAASFIQGGIAFTADTAKWGLGQVGLVPETVSFTTLLRESPVTVLRALGDTMSYADSGAVTNRKGYVVSEDMGAGTLLTRMLGFYPSAATRENDVIRLSKRISDYSRDIKATYVSSYVRARIEDDNRGANQIIRQVQEWNKSAKGTGLEIRDFMQSANRALREARRPATARYLKTAPKNVRPESELLLRLYGVE